MRRALAVAFLFAAACSSSTSSNDLSTTKPDSATSPADLAHAADLSQTTTDLATGSHDLSVTVVDMAHGVDLAHAPPDMAGVIESCQSSDYIDETAQTTVAVTPWNTSLGKKCLKVKSGTTVTWAASSSHPLEATTSTSTSPIPASPGAQTSQSIVFPNTGTFGYECHVHTSLMHGAILVVP